MKERTPHSRREVFTIMLAALVGVLVGFLALTWYFNRDDRWYKLVSPPNEPVVQILALDRGLNAYVKTQRGNLYLCGGYTWRDECRAVSPSELPTSRVPVQWLTCGSDFPALPPAPGIVIDAIAAGRCSGADTYSKLLVLADGSLWQWRRTFSWANGFARATGVILAGGIGLLCGLMLVKLTRYLR